MAKLGIVVLNYNNPLYTLDLVSNLLKQEQIDLTVFVVDNCSTDNSTTLLADGFFALDSVTFYQSESNGGYAQGNNYALKKMVGQDYKYVAILNNDLVIEDKLLFSKLISQYQQLPQVGFISPAQVNEEGRLTQYSGWSSPPFLTDCLMSFFLMRKFGRSNACVAKDDGPVSEAEVLAGSFLFTEFEFFEKIGFFDEGTFLFCEERIIADKTKEQGRKNYVIQDAQYKHMTSSTIDQEITSVGKYMILYQSLLYYTRNYRTLGLVKAAILWPLLQYSLLEIRLVSLVKSFFSRSSKP